MSKDFCASGLRIGVLHTRNAAILQAMDNLSYFHCCSAHTQWIVTQFGTNLKYKGMMFLQLAISIDTHGIWFPRNCSACKGPHQDV
eukprot:1150933-Pelagomonas_calceolata.AAC.4